MDWILALDLLATVIFAYGLLEVGYAKEHNLDVWKSLHQHLAAFVIPIFYLLGRIICWAIKTAPGAHLT